MKNYKFKKLVVAIMLIAYVSASFAGCGGMEGCGLRACSRDSGSPSISIVSPTPVEELSITVTPTIAVTDTLTPTVTMTLKPTHTPTPEPAYISVQGNNLRAYLYATVEEMDREMGYGGELDPEPVESIVAPYGKAYLRLYVKNPYGKEPEPYKTTDPLGNEVLITSQIMYKDAYMLLTDFTPGYQFSVDFRDDGGNATEIGFSWNREAMAYEITARQGQWVNVYIAVSDEGIIIPTSVPETVTPVPSLTATPTAKPTVTPTAMPVVTPTVTATPTMQVTPTPTNPQVTPVAHYVNRTFTSRYMATPRFWDETNGKKSFDKVALLMDNPQYRVVYSLYRGTSQNKQIIDFYLSNGQPHYLLYDSLNVYLMKDGAYPVGYLTEGTEDEYKAAGNDASRLPSMLDADGNKLFFSDFQQVYVTCTPVPTYVPVKYDTGTAKTDDVVHQILLRNQYPIKTYYLKYTDVYGNELVRFCDAKGNIVNDEYYINYYDKPDPHNADNHFIHFEPVNDQQMAYSITVMYRKNQPVLQYVRFRDKQINDDGYDYFDGMWDLDTMKPLKPGWTKFHFDTPFGDEGILKEYDEAENRFLWYYQDWSKWVKAGDPLPKVYINN